MAKIGDSKKKDNTILQIEYPKGYYTEDHPWVKDHPHLKVNGTVLLIHDDACRGKIAPPCFWRQWFDVKCPKCLKPFMVAVYIVPTEPFDDQWNFTREFFAGGNPQCFCNPKLKHYKYLSTRIEQEKTKSEKEATNPFKNMDTVPF